MTQSKIRFEKLLDPLDTNRFLRDSWEQQFVVHHRQQPDYYREIFSFEAMEGCLHSARRMSSAAVTVVPPRNSGLPGRRIRGTELSMKELYGAFSQGATIVLDGAEAISPSLGRVAAAFCEVLDAGVGINVYMTPADSQGFATHFDTHDVFVLQIEGAKEWHLYERFYDNPREKGDRRHYHRTQVRLDDEDKARHLETVELKAGDFLYLPRGYPHKAVAATQPSLHLTVSILPLYWLDLLKAAVEVLGEEEPKLRRALPPGYRADPAIRRAMNEEFAALVGTLTDRLPGAFAPSLEAIEAYSIRWSSKTPDGHFRQLIGLDDLDDESKVASRIGMAKRVEVSDAAASIAFPGGQVRGPVGLRAAFEYIRDQQRFRVGDLPGLSASARKTLVQRLIREGLLRIEESS